MATPIATAIPREAMMQRMVKGRRSTLANLLLLSLAAHALLLLGFGSVVIFRNIFTDDARFEAVEIEKTIDPRKLEFKVRVQEQQRSGGRPRVSPPIVANRITELSIPRIDVDSARGAESVNFIPGDFDLGAAGAGLARSNDRRLGQLAIGESNVEFFGIKSKGERVFFMVDASVSMAADERGGYAGWQKLKDEVERMVNELRPTSFFNLAVFAEGVQVMEEQMLLATRDNKKKARPFLEQFLTHDGVLYSTNVKRTYDPPESYNVKITTNLVHTDTTPREVKPTDLVWEYKPMISGSTRTDLAVLAALEQNADAIFIISDGQPRIRAGLSDRDVDLLNDRRMAWYREQAKDGFASLDAARKEDRGRARAEASAAERRSKGLPPEAREGGWGGGPAPPIPPWMESKDLVRLLKDFEGKLAEERQVKTDVRIYTVGYANDPGEEEFLKELARSFGGRYRAIKGLAPPITP